MLHCVLAGKLWLLSVEFRDNQIPGNIAEMPALWLFIALKLGDAKRSFLIKVVWGEPQHCELTILSAVPKHGAQHPEPMTRMLSRAYENIAIKDTSMGMEDIASVPPSKKSQNKGQPEEQNTKTQLLHQPLLQSVGLLILEQT